MTSIAEQAMNHVWRLAVDIGERMIGSASNHAAAGYIAGVFEQAGLQVEFQEFPCPDWKEVRTALVLDGQVLDARANTFSPSCDIAAPTVPIGSFADLEETEITGKIPLFYGDLAQRELAAKGAIYVSERDGKIVEILESRRPAGLITVNPSQYGIWRLVEDYDLDLPSVTVPARSGLKLIKRPGELIRLQVDSTRTPSHSANVVGRLPGLRPERIVLCAHYDTKVDTPGAYDNATGVAAILTLAGWLKDSSLQHTVEWVAFSGEEMYGLGDMEYIRRTGDGFGQITAAINFDGIGPRLAANSIATFSASQAFDDLVDRLKYGSPGVVRVDPWPASDHYTFYSHGVPSIAFGSVGIRDIYHTPSDTIDWIGPEKLAEVISLASEIVQSLDKMNPSWCRPGLR